jgi:hypothetical protein
LREHAVPSSQTDCSGRDHRQIEPDSRRISAQCQHGKNFERKRSHDVAPASGLACRIVPAKQGRDYLLSIRPSQEKNTVFSKIL